MVKLSVEHDVLASLFLKEKLARAKLSLDGRKIFCLECVDAHADFMN